MADERLGIVIQAVDEASKVLQQVQKELKTLDGTATTTNKSMQSFGKQMTSLGKDIAKAGAVLSVGITAPVVALGKAMVDQVASIEQYRIAFETMLGSAEEAGALLKEITDFAKTTPFELPQVVQSSKQLLALGIEQDKVLDTLKALGDVAAGTGADLTRLVLNYGQVATQTKLTGRELRDFAVNGIPLQQELAKQLGVSAAEVAGLVEEGQIGFAQVEKAFVDMTSEGGRFFDLMDKQSKTLGGVISNLKDNFVRLALSVLGVTAEGEILAGGPFDRLKTLAEQLLTAFEGLVEKMNSLSPQFRTVIVVVAAVAAALGPVLVGVGSLIAIAGGAATAIAGLAGALGITAASFTALLGPIGLAIAAMGGLAIATKAFFDALDTPEIQNLSKQLQDSIEIERKALGERQDAIRENFDEVLAEYEAHYDNLTDAEKEYYDEKLLDLANQYREEALLSAAAQEAEIQAAIEHAKTIAAVYDEKNNTIISREKAFFIKLGRTVVAFFEQIVAVAFTGISAFARTIVAGVVNIGQAFAETFKKIGGIVSSALAGDFKEAGSQALELLGGGFKDAIPNLTGAVRSALSGDFGGALGEMKQAIIDVVPGGNILQDTLADTTAIIGDELNALSQRTQQIGDKTQSVFDRFDGEQLLAGYTDEALKDSEELINKLNNVGTAGEDNLGGGAGGDGLEGSAKGATDRIKELGEELEDLGVFAIREGGKIVDTFDDAEKGVEKVKDRIEDLTERQEEFTEQTRVLGNEIRKELIEGFEPTEEIISNYDDLDEVLGAVEDTIKDIVGEHEKFVEDAKKGLEEYQQSLDETNSKFDELRESAGASAAQEAVDSLVAAQTRLKDATQELKDEEINLLDARRNADGAASAAAQERVTALKEEISDLQSIVLDYGKIKGTADQTASALERVNNEIARLSEDPTKNASQLLELERERLVLLGRQNLATEQADALAQAQADAKAEQELSEVDFIAYKLGQELAAIEEKRAAEIKAIEDVRKVQEAIVAGTISELDTTGLSQEAVDLATQAVAEQEAYRTNLETQLGILEEAKAQEQEIYQNTFNELQAQQAAFEQFTIGSYDRIIAKLEAVAAAARAAAAAQSSAGGFSAGGFTGFASGGFTGPGGKNQVAGVVHKGEWVAPKWMVNRFMPMFRHLEGVRKGRMAGFAEGGYTSPQTTYNQPITINGGQGSPSDLRSAARYMTWLLRTG